MLIETLQALIILTIRGVVAIAIVFPIVYFVHGTEGLAAAFMGFFIGFITWMWLLREGDLFIWQLLIVYAVVDAVFGLSYGLLIPSYQAAISQPSGRYAGAELVIASLIASLAVGWVVQVADLSRTVDQTKKRFKKVWADNFGVLLLFGVLIPMFPRIAALNQLSDVERVGWGLVVAVGAWVGTKVGAWLGRLTRILAISGGGVATEVRTLGASGVFFLVGYFILALFYSTIYAAVWKRNNTAFSGDGFPSDPTILDFLYFSISTIATLGYGDIFPRSLIARVIAMSEVLLGIAWVTVVLAATVARLGSQRAPSSPVPQQTHTTPSHELVSEQIESS